MDKANTQGQTRDELIKKYIRYSNIGSHNFSVSGIADMSIGTGNLVSVDGGMNVTIPHELASQYDAISLSIPHILIEPLLYNEYFVAVYDENSNLLLDKKYYTKSLLSAKITAYEISKTDSFKDYPIYICKTDPVTDTINYEKIVLKYKNEDTSETTN